MQGKINRDMGDQIRKSYFGDWPYGDAEAYLQPLSEMPYHAYFADNDSTRSITVLKILQYSAVAILLLALINYINLTSAENLKRTKEIATRRIIGARSLELIIQFMIEGFMINAISILLAMTVIQLIRMPMESLLGFYSPSFSGMTIPSLRIMAIVFVTSAIVSGIYPVWSFSRHSDRHLSAMKNGSQSLPTAWLTTFQYSLAIAIVVFAFTSKKQLDYVLTRDIGFTKEQILVVDLPVNRPEDFKGSLHVFMSKVIEMNGSVSRSVPREANNGFINLRKPGVGAGIGVEGHGGVDENYIPLYKIKLLAGRNFFQDNPADSSSILLSKITSHRIGFDTPEDAVGRNVIAGVSGNDKDVTVVGVFDDYEIRPALNSEFYQSEGLALTYKDFMFSAEGWPKPEKVSFRIRPESLTQSISKLESAYHESFSDPVFSWYFLDDVINGKYQRFVIASNQIAFFSILSVGIACLGLFGMMLYKVNSKVKEIGIRKILGAKYHQIGQVLLHTTVKQVLFACTIGIPTSWFLTQEFLEKFSAQVELEWWYFGLPVVILFLVMFFTVFSVVWRAANSNPVETLKHD